MNHDIYICYDKREKHLSDELYRLFEKNGINPWSKSKDMASGASIDTVTQAISESKCFVLIFGENKLCPDRTGHCIFKRNSDNRVQHRRGEINSKARIPPEDTNGNPVISKHQKATEKTGQ